jgi:hypothetical protein
MYKTIFTLALLLPSLLKTTALIISIPLGPNRNRMLNCMQKYQFCGSSVCSEGQGQRKAPKVKGKRERKLNDERARGTQIPSGGKNATCGKFIKINDSSLLT